MYLRAYIPINRHTNTTTLQGKLVDSYNMSYEIKKNIKRQYVM